MTHRIVSVKRGDKEYKLDDALLWTDGRESISEEVILDSDLFEVKWEKVSELPEASSKPDKAEEFRRSMILMGLEQSLVRKHLNGWTGLEALSVEHYGTSKHVSGSLFTAIRKMMREYYDKRTEMNLP